MFFDPQERAFFFFLRGVLGCIFCSSLLSFCVYTWICVLLGYTFLHVVLCIF